MIYVAEAYHNSTLFLSGIIKKRRTRLSLKRQAIFKTLPNNENCCLSYDLVKTQNVLF